MCKRTLFIDLGWVLILNTLMSLFVFWYLRFISSHKFSSPSHNPIEELSLKGKHLPNKLKSTNLDILALKIREALDSMDIICGFLTLAQQWNNANTFSSATSREVGFKQHQDWWPVTQRDLGGEVLNLRRSSHVVRRQLNMWKITLENRCKSCRYFERSTWCVKMFSDIPSLFKLNKAEVE